MLSPAKQGYPVHYYRDDVVYFGFGEFSALYIYAMPLEKALAAARGGGVLGDKNRVISHRRLFAVVR